MSIAPKGAVDTIGLQKCTRGGERAALAVSFDHHFSGCSTPNVEGDGTALAIASRLAGLPITITRLARGLTVGASLEQANRDMLADAIASRQPF